MSAAERAIDRDRRGPTPGPNDEPALRPARSVPIVTLLVYYAGLVALGLLLIEFVPGMEAGLVAPIEGTGGMDSLLGGAPGVAAPPAPWSGPGGRAALAFIAILGALALALPIAWVHMHTRRFRYDPSLVHAIIVLPIVVAGVVLVVKNSLALAFALAGIVAGVRFRQKLNEPQEAVYVLLSLGVGLAAGVQALDVALVMSGMFVGVVLLVWRFDLGAIYSGGRGGLLSIGDTRLLPPPGGAVRKRAAAHAIESADGLEPDGFLVVYARDAVAAKQSIDIAVGQVANSWRSTEDVLDRAGLTRFEVLVEFRKSMDALDLMAELEERCTREVAAAEYIPFSSGVPDAPDKGEK